MVYKIHTQRKTHKLISAKSNNFTKRLDELSSALANFNNNNINNDVKLKFKQVEHSTCVAEKKKR